MQASTSLISRLHQLHLFFSKLKKLCVFHNLFRMQRNSDGTASAGSQPACAACKHQRKKCHEGCTLAPYFPAERCREFQAVHKIFGVSNVTKMVKNVREEDRRRAVDSLVWEACCRQKDPVLGAYAEYKKVNEELKMYKLSQESQMLQLTAQRCSTGYKSLSSLVAWNDNNGTSINGINGTNGIGTGVSYFHDHNENNVMVDPTTFGYPSNYMQLGNSEKMRQEKHIDSVVVPFQQQYYHSAGNCM